MQVVRSDTIVIRMATTLTQAIATTVRAAMTAGGVTELGLSESTGIPRVTLRRRLAGSAFTTDELTAIAVALHTTPSEIVSTAERGAA